MENKIITDLEKLLNEFNQKIYNGNSEKQTTQNESFNLQKEYDRIMASYLQKVKSAFETLKIQSDSANEYLVSQFHVFQNNFQKTIDSHGIEQKSDLCHLNTSEFHQNLQTLSEENSDDKNKQEQIQKHSNSKEQAANENANSYIPKDMRASEYFQSELNLFVTNILSHTKKVHLSSAPNGREYMLQAASIEAKLSVLPDFFDKLNNSLVNAYQKALINHTKNILEDFKKGNTEYTASILDIAGLEKEVSTTIKSPFHNTLDYDPFAPVSSEVQENLKNTAQKFLQDKENNEPDKNKIDSLPEILL